LTDRLGSVRDVANNSTGVSIDHLDYDGFGNATESTPANGDRYKYTAREIDSESGLQYNRARYYDPKTGRWTSQDPLGFETGDVNLYRYVTNDPLAFVDPLGLDEGRVAALEVKAKQLDVFYELKGFAKKEGGGFTMTSTGKSEVDIDSRVTKRQVEYLGADNISSSKGDKIVLNRTFQDPEMGAMQHGAGARPVSVLKGDVGQGVKVKVTFASTSGKVTSTKVRPEVEFNLEPKDKGGKGGKGGLPIKPGVTIKPWVEVVTDQGTGDIQYNQTVTFDLWLDTHGDYTVEPQGVKGDGIGPKPDKGYGFAISTGSPDIETLISTWGWKKE
jgi:RHS repeat-associated protein